MRDTPEAQDIADQDTRCTRLEEKYAQTADTYDLIADGFRNVNLEVASMIHQEIDALLKHSPTKGKILDAGCGSGLYASYIATRGFQVTGVDFSKHQIAIAKLLYGSLGIDWRCENLVNHDFQKSSYDGILLNSSFHHILGKDRGHLLRRMFNSLHDHGRMLLITRVHPFTKQIEIKERRFGEETTRNSFRTTESDLYFLLADSGFIVDLTCHREPHHKDREGVFIHLLLRKNIQKYGFPPP
jgi:2-polyprenyl-3-methyl-5-hydroxy-6-metoxy-1,4-benzoquinol methylase